MKKTYFLLSFFLLNIGIGSAQYTVKSENILNPDANIEFVKNNLSFWVKNAYDPIYGGFFSSISRNGTATTVKKSFIAQTRQGYGFTRAFMLTGDESYLTYANSALKFLTDHGWDSTNEGWYCFANRDGSLDNRVGWNPNADKWGFQQQYALLGLVANYEATHNQAIKSWVDKGINSNNKNLWDSRTGFEGYYENAAADWSNKRQKGFTCTVDAITTNAELKYLITKEPQYRDRFFQLADIIANRFVPLIDDSRIKVLYPEVYSTDWDPDFTAGGSIGHFLKTAWCLGRAYLCDTTKTNYKDSAKKILDQAWNYQNGTSSIWDHVNGGPFFEMNVTTGVTSNDSKEYWTMEQGFTGPMINYYITQDPIYLQMADESISFFMNHAIDKVYGETYQYLDPTGTIVRNDIKGDDFKANYHCVELAYYAYLYSNLYYLYKPANLYYKFDAQPNAQNIELSPIPMEDGLLRIKSVTLDGADFNSFDPETRTLNIAANQGGKFRVTFESLDKSTSAISNLKSTQIRVYPNPATERIIIDGMDHISQVSLVDVSGKVVALAQKVVDSQMSFDVSRFAKGVYFVEMQTATGVKQVRKFIKR
ncbi:MAG: AGE family epimerase/isomerase [Bacteroidales bacterium]|nr:AGE family epimerase/isomerase [Bacteroidales bacterium]